MPLTQADKDRLAGDGNYSPVHINNRVEAMREEHGVQRKGKGGKGGRGGKGKGKRVACGDEGEDSDGGDDHDQFVRAMRKGKRTE